MLKGIFLNFRIPNIRSDKIQKYDLLTKGIQNGLACKKIMNCSFIIQTKSDRLNLLA